MADGTVALLKKVCVPKDSLLTKGLRSVKDIPPASSFSIEFL